MAGKDVFSSGKGRKQPEISGKRYSGFLWKQDAARSDHVAHVFFETSRSVSYELKDKTSGINPYGGAVEIFYPRGNRKLLPLQLTGTYSNKVYSIVNAVFNHMNQLHVEYRFSWSQLQANRLRQQLSLTLQRVEEKREKIKACLRGYSKLTPTIKKELENIGFSLSDDGKHVKAVFANDQRYMGTLSKTGSDHRAGDNLAHDLIRLIFN